MPRQTGVSVDNNFSKGLITEASGLNFPESACTETYNCIFDFTGQVARRPGLDFELNYNTKTIARANSAITSYLWKNPAGEANVNLLVVQVGPTLYFWNAGTDASISGSPLADTVDLTAFIPSGGTDPTNNECQFSTGNGLLFVTNPNLESFYVTYNPSTATVDQTAISLMIRDFEGDTADALAVDARPTSTLGGLSAAHVYNLLNQGWNSTNLQVWDAGSTNMPSNVDVMWRFKDSSGAFALSVVSNHFFGNSPAPKGHYVLNVYNQDRNTASATTGVTPGVVTTVRASANAFFAGRVFYAGIQQEKLTSTILFSQIVTTAGDYGKCYQTNDPTAEDLFDLLPSDGGVIRIQDAGSIIKLFAVQTGLVVSATNGTWFITGSTGLGFTATDYTVIKLSSVPGLSASSFVDVEGYPAWWNLNGIYRIKEGSTGGSGVSVEPLTVTTIQTFFDDIPPAAKRFAKGYYNKLSKIVQWLYTTTPTASVDDTYNFDAVLNLDTKIGAFYPWLVETSGVKLNGLVVVEGSSGSVIAEQVVVGSDNVVVGSDNVVVFELGNSATAPLFKYIVSYNDGSNKFTIADVRNENYIDWHSYTSSMNYDSYFISGYKLRGNAMNDFQSNYVTFYADINSQFTVKGVWDYATANGSVRWSQPQTVNTVQTNQNFSVIPKRLKVRGRGKALQFKVESVDGEPFNILGWSMYSSANATP